MSRRAVWFSCGAASAVAAKLAIEKYGSDCAVVYCDTMGSEHPDNRRFFGEVQDWIGVQIEVIRSDKYLSIDEVFDTRRYMSGIAGAICTTEMKKLPRVEWQRPDDIHIFGYTSDEQRRADSFEKQNPSLDVEWILIDEQVSKKECLLRLENAGIALPAMYALGFEHNNCIGCVKATSPGYWNRTRRLFPETFKLRADQSRRIGARLVRIGGVRKYLDELPLDASGPDDDIECGPVCQTPETK